MVSEHRALLEAFAQTLLENEVLERGDIDKLVAEHEGAALTQDRLRPLAGGTERRVAASDPSPDA
jgi:hypothetical protein